MKRGRIIVLVLVGLILAGAGAAAGARRRHTAAPSAPVAPKAPSVTDAPTTLREPDSLRIRVQVLNATKTHGLARRATMLLRDRGLDVVEIGTIGETRDTTLVLDLSGHPDWAKRVAQIMGPARVEARTDSSRYLDIAVILGSTWRPPAGPFRP